MGQSQPKTTTVDPVFVQQIYRPKDFRALADQINRYRQDAFSSMQDIERMTGAPADIGSRRAATFENAAASYLSSLPRADKYIQATTGVGDPYAPARESARSYLDLNKGLAQEAEQAAASYEAPTFERKHFSWEDIPPPGASKKQQRRMARTAEGFNWEGLPKD